MSMFFVYSFAMSNISSDIVRQSDDFVKLPEGKLNLLYKFAFESEFKKCLFKNTW